MTVEELATEENIGLQVAYKRCQQAYRRRGGLLKIPGRPMSYVVSKPGRSYYIQPVAADPTKQLISILTNMIDYVCPSCEGVVARVISNLEDDH